MPSRAFLQNKPEVLSLTATAKLSNKAPSEITGLEDEEIAFAFNQACAETLYMWEQEQETLRFAAIAGGSMVGQLKNAGRDITPDNFGDQSW